MVGRQPLASLFNCRQAIGKVKECQRNQREGSKVDLVNGDFAETELVSPDGFGFFRGGKDEMLHAQRVQHSLYTRKQGLEVTLHALYTSKNTDIERAKDRDIL